MTEKNEERKETKDYQIVENPENSEDKSLEMKWQIIKLEYKKKYPQLPDSLYDYLPGQFDKMMDRIASNTQRSWAQVHNEIMHWDNNQPNF